MGESANPGAKLRLDRRVRLEFRGFRGCPPQGGGERVAGRRDRRMRLWPESIDESDINLRWIMTKYLEVIEEVACSLQVSKADAPGMEGAWERARQAVGRRDREAEDEALADRSWAEIRNWWQDFSERDLLANLYQRATRRREGRGSPDSRRRPSHQEGLRVAVAMLAGTARTVRFDDERESAAVSTALVALSMPPFGVRSRGLLRKYITRSRSSRVYFDALRLIFEELGKQDKAIPRVLARWQQEVADGHRPRPAMKPISAHRPANPDRFTRDVHLQFTLAILARVGVSPRGSVVSGCRIVSEALGISEDTVGRIWNECPWRGSLLPAMQKYSKAIAIRTGLHPTST